MEGLVSLMPVFSGSFRDTSRTFEVCFGGSRIIPDPETIRYIYGICFLFFDLYRCGGWLD